MLNPAVVKSIFLNNKTPYLINIFHGSLTSNQIKTELEGVDVGFGGGRQQPSPLSLSMFTAPSLTPKALGGLQHLKDPLISKS